MSNLINITYYINTFLGINKLRKCYCTAKEYRLSNRYEWITKVIKLKNLK